MQTNKLTASALLICTCVIWGIQPMFAKFVVREMSPIPMVSIRYTIVALTLFAMLAWRRRKAAATTQNLAGFIYHGHPWRLHQ